MDRTLFETAKKSLRDFNYLRGSLECMKRLSEGGDTRYDERIRRTSALISATELALSSLTERQFDILTEFYVDRKDDSVGSAARYFE